MPQTCLITSLSWGKIKISLGKELLTFKDCKIWPGGAGAWDWSETGTGHNPGIQFADIIEILDNGAEVVVFGQGMFSRLGICRETESKLQEEGIEYHLLETGKAVELFNKLVMQGRKVGGLFHSTC